MSLRSEKYHTRRASSESASLLATSTSIAEKKHMTINTALAQCQEREIGPRHISQPNEPVPMKWQFDEIHRIQQDYKKFGRDLGEYQDKLSTMQKTINEGRLCSEMHYRSLSHPASYPRLSQTAKHQELRHRHSSSELNILKRRASHNYYYGSRPPVMNPFSHVPLGAYESHYMDSDDMILQKNRFDELDLELELLRTPRSASIFSSSSFGSGVFSPQPLTPLSSSSSSFSPSTPYSALFPPAIDNEEYLRMQFPLDEERWQLLVQPLESSTVGSGSYKPSVPVHESTNKPSTSPYSNDYYAATHLNTGNSAMDQCPFQRVMQKESPFGQAGPSLRNSPQDPIGTRTRKSGSPEPPVPIDSSSQTRFSFFARSPTTSFNKVSTYLTADKSTVINDGGFSPFKCYSPTSLSSGEDYFSLLKKSSRQKFDKESKLEPLSCGNLYPSSIREREEEILRAGSRSYTGRQPLQPFDDGWDTYELRMDMDRAQHARNFARSEMIPRRPRYYSARTTVQDPALIRRSSESQINSIFQRLNDNVDAVNRAESADLRARAEALVTREEWRFHNSYKSPMKEDKIDGLVLGVM